MGNNDAKNQFFIKWQSSEQKYHTKKLFDRMREYVKDMIDLVERYANLIETIDFWKL